MADHTYECSPYYRYSGYSSNSPNYDITAASLANMSCPSPDNVEALQLQKHYSSYITGAHHNAYYQPQHPPKHNSSHRQRAASTLPPPLYPLTRNSSECPPIRLGPASALSATDAADFTGRGSAHLDNRCDVALGQECKQLGCNCKPARTTISSSILTPTTGASRKLMSDTGIICPSSNARSSAPPLSLDPHLYSTSRTVAAMTPTVVNAEGATPWTPSYANGSLSYYMSSGFTSNHFLGRPSAPSFPQRQQHGYYTNDSPERSYETQEKNVGRRGSYSSYLRGGGDYASSHVRNGSPRGGRAEQHLHSTHTSQYLSHDQRQLYSRRFPSNPHSTREEEYSPLAATARSHEASHDADLNSYRHRSQHSDHQWDAYSHSFKHQKHQPAHLPYGSHHHHHSVYSPSPVPSSHIHYQLHNSSRYCPYKSQPRTIFPSPLSNTTPPFPPSSYMAPSHQHYPYQQQPYQQHYPPSLSILAHQPQSVPVSCSLVSRADSLDPSVAHGPCPIPASDPALAPMGDLGRAATIYSSARVNKDVETGHMGSSVTGPWDTSFNHRLSAQGVRPDLDIAVSTEHIPALPMTHKRRFSSVDENPTKRQCSSTSIYCSSEHLASHHPQPLPPLPKTAGGVPSFGVAVPSLEHTSYFHEFGSSPAPLALTQAPQCYVDTPEYVRKVDERIVIDLSADSPEPTTQVVYPSNSASENLAEIKPTSRLLALLKKESEWVSPPKGTSLLSRSELVDLICEYSRTRHYQGETIYMTINIMDRYRARVRVSQRKQGHLLALSCLYIAAKLAEETIEPFTGDMLHDVMYIFSRKDIKRMERKICSVLDWNFTFVTPHAILHEIFNSLGTPDVRFSSFSRAKSSLSTNGYWGPPVPPPPPHFTESPLPPSVATRDNVFAMLDTALLHMATSTSLTHSYSSVTPATLINTFLSSLTNLEHTGVSQTVLDHAGILLKDCAIFPNFLLKCKTVLALNV
ncbi:hypothetical protein BASA50_005289 [Batrachochytrium salamandrivorans]|uniref:Cyclin-like domain-containing protein n=1 Tax=Batrachochytrium salamandrivorans TaxID=1357716 RepID=A0ABQ8FDN4_9FUNG|nr:hypothetical protein BASA50_005289 [Batrachochytrium salamandrivorans]